MKIKDILRGGGVSVSLEIFPPKREENLDRTREVVERLCRRKPSFVSVTCGAASTRDAHTADVAAFVAARGVTALAHMTCVGAPVSAVRGQLARLRALAPHVRGIGIEIEPVVHIAESRSRMVAKEGFEPSTQGL